MIWDQINITMEITFHSDKTSKAIGPVELNQSRSLIRNTLGSDEKGKSKSDYFRDIDLSVHYDQKGKSIFMEAGKCSGVELHDISVFDTSFNKLRKHLLTLDKDLEVSEGGYTVTSYFLGIALWTNEKTTKPPYTIAIFRKGYYDNVLNN